MNAQENAKELALIEETMEWILDHQGIKNLIDDRVRSYMDYNQSFWSAEGVTMGKAIRDEVFCQRQNYEYTKFLGRLVAHC